MTIINAKTLVAYHALQLMTQAALLHRYQTTEEYTILRYGNHVVASRIYLIKYVRNCAQAINGAFKLREAVDAVNELIELGILKEIPKTVDRPGSLYYVTDLDTTNLLIVDQVI